MKLMVVDDETATRNGILKHVHWAELGIEQIKAVQTAQEALELSLLWKPDIVISDIRMPDMDGITLCRKIKEILPFCCLIFISGFADKENLIAAISMSAVSFVEKPFTILELEAAIHKAAAQCAARVENISLKQSLNGNLMMIEDGVVRNLLNGKIDDALKENLELLCLGNRENECYEVLIFEIKEAIKTRAEFLGSVIPYLEQDGKKVLKTFLGDRCMAVILISRRKSDFIKEKQKEYIIELIERLTWNGTPLFCAIGPAVGTIEKITLSYGKAKAVLDSLFWSGYGTVMFYDRNTRDFYANRTKPELNDLRESIRNYDIEKMEKLETWLYDFAKRGTVYTLNEIRKIYFRLMYDVESAALRLVHKETVENGDEIWRQINSMDTFEMLHLWFLETAKKRLQPSYERHGVSDTVFSVIRKIKEEYANEKLDITFLAGEVYLTPTYLSNLFKKETGFTIGQYITQVRMQAAKQLLISDMSLKLYQIAQMCGYSDQNYFAKIFKRQEGINPSEFRQIRVQKKE